MHARVCVGAWVRWWFPGCTVNPSARETLRLHARCFPFSRFAMEGASASRCQRVASKSCPPKDFPTAAPAPSPNLSTAHCPLFTPTLRPLCAHSAFMPALARS